MPYEPGAGQGNREFVTALSVIVTSTRGTGERTMSTEGRSDRDVTPLAWIPGDQWGFHYLWEISGRQGTFVWIVAADVDVDGLPSYVVRVELRVGSKEMVFAKGHGQLGWSMEQGGNGPRKRASPPNFYLAWPLKVGQRWEVTYTWGEFRNGNWQTKPQTRRCTVKAREVVTVPAGTFQTFRVVCTNERDEPVYMYWFAEAVKMFVRDRTYFAKDIRTRELTSYMLKEKPDPDTGEGDDGGADGDGGGDGGDGDGGDGGDGDDGGDGGDGGDEFPKSPG